MSLKVGVWWLSPILILLALYLVLMPLDTPLYDLILFPCPDPRVVNLDKEFASLRAFGISKKDVTLVSANGKHLKAWFLEVPHARRVFLYSHSKGNNIYGKLQVAQALLACGGSVLMYDYQGYGESEGRASLQNACDDGLAAYDYLVKDEHRRQKEIIGFGESLGSGVTGYIASKRTLGGVIFQSGFSTMKRSGEDSLFWLKFYPDCLFPPPIMDNVKVFSKAHPPLLMSNAKGDKVVTYENAMVLYKSALPPKTLVTFEGAGHGTVGKNGEFYAAVRQFLRANGL